MMAASNRARLASAPRSAARILGEYVTANQYFKKLNIIFRNYQIKLAHFFDFMRLICSLSPNLTEDTPFRTHMM
ncbi:hypothetical protein [Breoghania sp.]|uniref:hypothetical protein n=1 Tax=Breoghania sp. TaxID=2065378 RepID=UPI002629E389|nr:hypothetical protein [Breoghania sp.]MDJ0933123.1 hypothetical protein [Breoghania sp.]